MRSLKKKILSKLIHPAIVMLLEQREENPHLIGNEIPGYYKFTWLEKKLITRQIKNRYKESAKKEKQKYYDQIIISIINPEDQINKEAQIASDARKGRDRILNIQEKQLEELKRVFFDVHKNKAQSHIQRQKQKWDMYKDEWYKSKGNNT